MALTVASRAVRFAALLTATLRPRPEGVDTMRPHHTGPGPDGPTSTGPAVSSNGGCGRTVECVLESGRRVSLISLGPDGVTPWTGVVIRPVAAYQRATMGVCGLLVVLTAVLARPLLSDVATGWRAGVGVVVVGAAWLLSNVVAGRVWARLVESLVTDTAQAILDTTDMPLPPSGEQQGEQS
jgi:hypothetical protein